MFRMMKLHQNVKGKLLSFAVSLAVFALTIVGAFAVSFGTANAAFSESSISWSQFKEQLLQHYPLEMWSGTDFSVFDDLITNHLDDHDYFIALAVGRNQDGAYDFDYFACSIFRTNSTGNYKWANDAQGKLITINGSFEYFSEAKMFACNPSQSVVWSSVSANLNYFRTSRFNNTVSFTYGNQFANTIATRNQEGCFLFCNQDVYDNAGNLISAKNLSLGPQPTYNNIIIKTGDRYYFTISDQSLIRAGAASDDSIRIDLGSSDPNFTDYYVCPCIDFTYLAIYAYPGIINISINGILGWDITDVVKYTTAEFISFSEFLIDDDFGNNQVAIVRDNVPDPWSTYYDYVNKLLELTDSPNHITTNDPPAYVSSNVYTSYKDLYVAGGGMSDAGNIILNELPSVPFDTVLVCSTKLFDDLGNKVDLLNVQASTTAFINYLSPYLLEQIDLIVVLPDDGFSNALQGQPDHPDNFVNWNPYQWNIGVASGPHGYFYYTSPTIRDITANDVSGFAFCTQRYLDKCRNYMLSDGIRQIYEGLNAVTENQDNIITAIVNGAGSVYSSIQLCYGKLDNIYSLLNDINLSNKLQNIVDKLEKIADNTSEQTHNYWFISLYNWLSQFAPSNSDFAQWVFDLTEFEQSLPDPEATPAATVIPFPTVTAATG